MVELYDDILSPTGLPEPLAIYREDVEYDAEDIFADDYMDIPDMEETFSQIFDEAPVAETPENYGPADDDDPYGPTWTFSVSIRNKTR